MSRRRKRHAQARMRAVNGTSRLQQPNDRPENAAASAILADRIPQRRNPKQAERLLDLIDSLETERRTG